MIHNQKWSEIQESSNYWGMKLMLLAFKWGGRPLFVFLLYFVIAFYFLVRADARHNSLKFLRQVHDFSGEQSPWRTQPGLRQSFQHFMTFGDALIDRYLMWFGYYPAKDMRLTGGEHLHALQEKKQGALLIMSHLGNVDICRVMGEFKGVTLTILSYNQNTPTFQRLLAEVAHTENNINIIQLDNVNATLAMQIQECLNRGDYVVIAGDRYPVKAVDRSEPIPFLGKTALFAQGPLLLASLFSCPVLLLFCMKEGKHYHVYLEKFSDGLAIPRKERAERLRAEMKRYAERLEHYACRYPLQWYNFFEYWHHETSS